MTTPDLSHITSPELTPKGSRLVERIREDLHSQAIYLTSHSIGLVIAYYEKRRAKYDS